MSDMILDAIERDLRTDIRNTQKRIKDAMRETNADSVIRLKIYMERLEVYRDCLSNVKKLRKSPPKPKA